MMLQAVPAPSAGFDLLPFRRREAAICQARAWAEGVLRRFWARVWFHDRRLAVAASAAHAQGLLTSRCG